MKAVRLCALTIPVKQIQVPIRFFCKYLMCVLTFLSIVWPRVSLAERDRGAVEPVLNNDWIADRLHELLQHAEEEGDILLSCPFHLVGIGNGACIAAGILFIFYSLYFQL